MDSLILENFRSFGGRHEVELAPLTVLVGENSSGKSTFLAATRIAWDIGAGPQAVNFNEDPFRLGAYEQIATSRGAPIGRAKSFSIGQEIRSKRRGAASGERIRVEACFVSNNSQPFLCQLSLDSGGYGITIDSTPDESIGATIVTPEGRFELPKDDMIRRTGFAPSLRWLALTVELQLHRGGALGDGQVQVPESAIDTLRELVASVRQRDDGRPHAFAPVRSRPQRTYDPISDAPDPEGQHVPMVLRQLLADSKGKVDGLGRIVAEFGKESGLFSDIYVHDLGKGSDPFQIFVKSSGPRRNIIDVGYGVSQILPILVEVATRPRGSIFLIQQPEVHLHPRAQAALATLFGRLVKERRCQLIIETHSDYFIDRLRMDVRDGKAIRPDDVTLIYFELGKTGSEISPISIDRRGNILDAPPSYRRFFLEEERRFFGGA
ncbi:MAG: AAA family ATPase [Dehalococcoidia bacterium]